MRAGLNPEAMLMAWEAGLGRAPLDRALVLLWAGGHGDAADLALAERDRLLLALRRATFGPVLDCVAACPDCGADVEVTLEADALAGALEAPVPGPLRIGSRAVTLAPLTSRDLAAARGVAPEALPGFLRARLVPDGEALSETEARAIEAEIEARAAAAEARCLLTCPDCGADWRESVDIAAHLWAEVEAAALRLLAEVAELARAYGWREADVLALSPARRAAYLRLARGTT
ncbi:hypothetical protein [Rhodovulum steppense]|nr:hypothetical protein [Rhodovulum steppense]